MRAQGKYSSAHLPIQRRDEMRWWLDGDTSIVSELISWFYILLAKLPARKSDLPLSASYLALPPKLSCLAMPPKEGRHQGQPMHKLHNHVHEPRFSKLREPCASEADCTRPIVTLPVLTATRASGNKEKSCRSGPDLSIEQAICVIDSAARSRHQVEPTKQRGRLPTTATTTTRQYRGK